MLAADKDILVADIKVATLVLRQKELDYYVQRYSNIGTQSIILAGFAFDALVETTIEQKIQDKRPAVVTVFWVSAATTMAFAVFTTYVSFFSTVYGQRLALQGPTGSVEKAVAVMMRQRTSIFVTFGLALTSLVVTAVTMSWLMMDQQGEAVAHETPTTVTVIFFLFFLALLWKNQYMKGVFYIPAEFMVQGDVRLNLGRGAAEVDCSRLEAGEPDPSTRGAPVARGEAGPSSAGAGPSTMGAPPTTTPVTVFGTLFGAPQYEETRDVTLHTSSIDDR